MAGQAEEAFVGFLLVGGGVNESDGEAEGDQKGRVTGDHGGQAAVRRSGSPFVMTMVCS